MFVDLKNKNWLQTFSEGELADDKPKESDKGKKKKNEGDEEPKTFTQDEVNRMMAREKQQGRDSVYNTLGVDPTDTQRISQVKKLFDALLSEENVELEELPQPVQKTISKTQQKAQEAERRATLAEAKVVALSNDANPSHLEDVIMLATSKVTDDKPLEAVIEEMKNTHAFFFNKPKGDVGTGKNVGKNNQGAKKKEELNYGQILAREAAARRGLNKK